MIDVSRRGFLFGTGALAAGLAVGKLPGSVPVLYGDGEHDDTAALQALVDGKPVNIKGDGVFAHSKPGEPIYISGGHFRVSSPVRVNTDCDLTLSSSTFRGEDMDYLIRVEGAEGFALTNCLLEGGGIYVDGRNGKIGRVFLHGNCIVGAKSYGFEYVVPLVPLVA